MNDVNETPLVLVVDDDPRMRKFLTELLNSVSIEVKTYADAQEFLADFSPPSATPVLLLLDVRMPGMSGMALLENLRAECPSLPIIMITGYGDVEMAVRAMKLGALDFITKPFAAQRLLDRVQEVLWRTDTTAPVVVSAQEAHARLRALSTREREVFERIVGGSTNKAIAQELGISIRTVETHRAKIMKKMKARTLAELIRLGIKLNKGCGRFD